MTRMPARTIAVPLRGQAVAMEVSRKIASYDACSEYLVINYIGKGQVEASILKERHSPICYTNIRFLQPLPPSVCIRNQGFGIGVGVGRNF
jgi:hypothetical protein